MMTKERLLNPRYVVIADYPFSLLKINDVIEQTNIALNHYDVRVSEDGWLSEFDGRQVFNPEKYKVLFRKLEWHELRKREDLPAYIKIDAVVFKVDRWTEGGGGGWNPKTTTARRSDDFIVEWFFGKDRSVPATEDEYVSYKALKK